MEDVMLGTSNPFSAEVMATPFPKKFKMLTIPYYDRTVYPSEHLGKFTLWMRLYGVHEHIMYRAFDSILSSNS